MPVVGDAFGIGEVASALKTFATPLLNLIPDPRAKAAALLQAHQAADDLAQTIAKNQQATIQAEFDLLKAQIDVNKTEAASPNWFVAGWRPFLCWGCSFVFIIVPLGSYVASFFGAHPGPPMELYYTLTSVLVALAGIRTYDKLKGVDTAWPAGSPPPAVTPAPQYTPPAVQVAPTSVPPAAPVSIPSPAPAIVEKPITAADVYTPRFQTFVKFILQRETSRDEKTGEVITEHDPRDSGGATRYGIDQRSHPGINVDKLTEAEAIAIYFAGDWTATKAEQLPEPIGELICDIHVVGGHGTTWLQECLNAGGMDLKTDGYIGPFTLAAAKSCDVAKVTACILAKRDLYYEGLAQSIPKDHAFLSGWLDRDKLFVVWAKRNAGLA